MVTDQMLLLFLLLGWSIECIFKSAGVRGSGVGEEGPDGECLLIGVHFHLRMYCKTIWDYLS